MTATLWSTGWKHELDVLLPAVRQACEMVREVYRTDFDVDYKSHREPVTVADRRVNELLCSRIAAVFGSDAILAEESAPSDERQRQAIVTRKRVWFIDPLDGTKEFIARNGEFAVMVGLAIDGGATLGVLGMPVQRQVAVGIVGEGAWLLDDDGRHQELSVAPCDELRQATALLSRSHRSSKLLQVMDTLGSQQVARGSVGYKALSIARGEAHLYVNLPARGGAKLWDGCGPEAVVRAAGGTVTDVYGEPIRYNTPAIELERGFVASNSQLHAAIIAVTASC